MLAGGELFRGGRTPAKPKWSEVMIFLKVVLRQGVVIGEFRFFERQSKFLYSLYLFYDSYIRKFGVKLK